jgi:hypothetical protein
MTKALRTLACLCVLTTLAGSAFAQGAVIQGRLADQQGGSLAGATVRAQDEDKGLVVRETTTSTDGSFRLQPLLPGRYTVKAELAGFRALERRDLVLDANQVMNLGELTLELGAVTETVQAEATVPLVETTTAQKSFVISSRQVEDLLANGRSFDSLVKTLPGVTTSAGSDYVFGFGGTTGFSVNGGRTSMNGMFLDGVPNTDQGDNGSQYTQLSLDAVAQFKVQTTTFNAEYGRHVGTMISAVTKSGGKDFHGSLWEFNRNGKRDAANPFNGLKPTLKQDIYGANLGGWLPLPGVSSRDNKKLFFFVNYEGTRGKNPDGTPYFDVLHPDVLNGDLSRFLRPGLIAGTNFQIGTVFRPGTIVRNSAGQIVGGVPYPGNVIPRSEWSRNAPAFLRLLGALNRSGAPEVPNSPELVRVPGQAVYRLNKDQVAVRLDYNLSPRANLFFRFVNDYQHEERERGTFGSNNPFPVYPQLREKPGQSWSLNLVNVISPSMTNEAVVAYNHQSQVVDAVDGLDPATYDRERLGFTFGQLFPQANKRNRFPSFVNCGGPCDFTEFASTWENTGDDYALMDNLTLARDRHTFKAGIYVNLDDKEQQPAWNDAGTFDFASSPQNPMDSANGFANLLLGNYTSLSQSSAKLLGKFRFWGFETYLQDTWRVSSRLTLELGARYVYLGPTYTYGDILATYFDPARYDPARAVRIDTTSPAPLRGSIVPGSGDPANGMVREGDAGVPKGFVEHRTNQVAPRLGFAWDLTGDGKTSLRGGAGIFYERIRQNVNNFDGLANPPLLDTPNLLAGSVDDVSPALIAGGIRRPQGVAAMDKNGFIPTVYAWQVGVQRELPWKLVIDVAYVGNTARHLQYRKNINTLPLGTTLNSSVLADANGVVDAARPYKGYTSINLTDYGANSNYHGLQARLSRRFGEGLSGNVNYTWSRALTQQNADDGSIQYPFDREREWGPTGQDRRHVLSVDAIYNLPKMGGGSPVGRFLLNGWQVSGIARFWSGLPLTVTAGGTGGNNSMGTLPGNDQRADYLGGDLYPGNQTKDQWFNPFVFGRPALGTLGNTPRGFLRGPGVTNLDFSVYKSTTVGRVRTQLRLEAFNALNHPQFFGVSTTVPGSLNPGTAVTPGTQGTFGSITSFRDPRTLQLALKLYF